MKKMFLALAAAMMMSASAMAQEAQQQQPRQMDQGEMAKMRTEQMVKDYGLNEEQAAKLLELNTEFQSKMPMMGRGMRGGQRPQMGQGGERPQRQMGQGGERPQRPQMGQGGERPRMNFEEMQKNMEAYQAGLEKIFTEEQMAKYKENMQNRMQRGQRGGGQGGFQRQRPQRND